MLVQNSTNRCWVSKENFKLQLHNMHIESRRKLHTRFSKNPHTPFRVALTLLKEQKHGRTLQSEKFCFS